MGHEGMERRRKVREKKLKSPSTVLLGERTVWLQNFFKSGGKALFDIF